MRDYQQCANAFLNKIADQEKIPGIAAVIIQNQETNFFYYGYSDIRRKMKVNENTLFEIGSMSKAFTALAILLLKNQNKLSLEDKVSNYIPEVEAWYKNGNNKVKCDITIDDLLYHRSGIAFENVHTIPIGDSDDILKESVLRLKDIALVMEPGKKFTYSSENMNLLAYLIQVISGVSYEEFLMKNIIKPLGLNDTYVFRRDAMLTGRMSKGYQYIFFIPREKKSQNCRANTPSAYIITSIRDMDRWMNIQMRRIPVDKLYEKSIIESHIGKYPIDEDENEWIGAGWKVDKKGMIYFRGQNENFQSDIIVDVRNYYGVCVLGNILNNNIYYIAENILRCYKSSLIPPYKVSPFRKIDCVLSTINISFWGIYLVGGIAIIRKICAKSIAFSFHLTTLFPLIVLVMLSAFCFHKMTFKVLDYQKVKWPVLKLWGKSIYILKYTVYLGIALLSILLMFQ